MIIPGCNSRIAGHDARETPPASDAGSPVGDALDGRHIRAFRLPGEHGARLARLAVDMHDAGAALGRVAADMRSGQAKIFPQKLDQQGSGIDILGDDLAVHRHRYGSHVHSSPVNRSFCCYATAEQRA
jgi:hypothetical protein